MIPGYTVNWRLFSKLANENGKVSTNKILGSLEILAIKNHRGCT